MQRENKIKYEGVNFNNQPTCCLFSNSIAQKQSIQFYKKPQKYYIHNPEKKIEKINNQELEQIRSRRATVSTLKKSLSGINLKRKNSQNQKTNRTFYQPSEVSQNLNKRFVTTSMDAQIFKYYFPNSQRQQRKRSAFLSPTQSYDQLNKNKQSLESLLIKNQKRKKEENMQKLLAKQSNYFHSYKTNEITSTKATAITFQNNNIAILKKQNRKQFQHQIPAFLKQRKQLKGQKQKSNQKLKQSQKIKQYQKFKNKQQSKPNSDKKLFNMNQVQSILINVSTQNKNNQKKEQPLIKKFSKQVLQNRTVNSQYQPDDEEVNQRVQQSAILVNYFNPPSFIKQKFNSTIMKSKVFKQYQSPQNQKRQKI